MMEMTIKIEAPDLVAAVEKLAAAIAPHKATTALVPPVVPAPVSTPVQTAQSVDNSSAEPIPVVPVSAPTYTMDQIAKAGACLVDAGKMNDLLALLGKYSVQAVTQIKPEQYGAFVTELRALGAQI